MKSTFMMHRFTTLAALSAMLLAFGCTAPRSGSRGPGPAPLDPAPLEVATLPMPGSRIRFPFPSKYVVLVSSAQFMPAYEVQFQGVLYQVAVGGDVVGYISTSDPRFQSPEGLRVGDSFQRVREHGGGEPRLMPGWGYHSALPSGWYAAFRWPEQHPYPDLSPDARVLWFFRR